MSNSPAIEVKTTVRVDGMIEQRVFGNDINGAMQLLYTRVINVQEEQIRQALISLGWTPPDAAHMVALVLGGKTAA